MKPRRTFASALGAACLCAALGSTLYAGPAWAQQDPAEPGAETEQKKKKTSEERITEYLQKKEQKRIQREQQRLAKEEADRVKAEQAAAAKAEAQAAEQQAAADKQAAKEQRRLEKQQAAAAGASAAKAEADSELPKVLAQAQESVRLTTLAQDPTIQAYLDLVDQQEASPHQLAALGNFLADVGLLEEAMAYYSVALNMEKNDPVLWINAGTLHRQRAELNDAIDAYARALTLDRNNAVAHYNLGAALDVKGKYDEAIEEYKTALTLDPSLGDPRFNPAAVSNTSLAAVKLMLYQEQAGRSGLPMLAVPGGQLEQPSAKDDTPQ